MPDKMFTVVDSAVNVDRKSLRVVAHAGQATWKRIQAIVYAHFGRIGKSAEHFLDEINFLIVAKLVLDAGDERGIINDIFFKF